MLLEVSNLTVCFDKAMIINGLSMHVNDGELVSLVGSKWCRKVNPSEGHHRPGDLGKRYSSGYG